MESVMEQELILLYTKKMCPQCMYVKSELRMMGISVTEIDIDKSALAQLILKEHGIFHVPTIQIKDDFFTGTLDILKRLDVFYHWR